MNQVEIDTLLAPTLADSRLERAEAKALKAALAGCPDQVLGLVRSRAFDLARAHPEPASMFEWLEAVVKLVQPGARSSGGAEVEAEALFSPGDDCWRRIVGLLSTTRQAADLCVFTITDDRISDAILAAHARNVRVRILTDNDKSADVGSDVERFRAAGITVRRDVSEFHMHHKFAIFDDRRLLTGSYNWTRSAAAVNEENFILTTEPRLVRPFVRTFADLWTKFS